MSLSLLRVHAGSSKWIDAPIVRGVKSVQATRWQGWVGDFAVLFLDECMPAEQETVKLSTPEGGLGKDRTPVNLVGWGVSNTASMPWRMSADLNHLETFTSASLECRMVVRSSLYMRQLPGNSCIVSCEVVAGCIVGIDVRKRQRTVLCL